MTQAEKTFLNRMVPHMMAGASVEGAGRAVIADDERLRQAALARDEVGETIRAAISYAVHKKIRGAK